MLVDLLPNRARTTWLLLAAALLTLILGAPAVARAETIYPNVATDTGTGISNCSYSNPPASPSGTEECSLRQAIEFAKSGDTISLTAPAPTTGYTLEKELSIAGKAITIVSGGGTISAGKKSRLFSVASGATLTLTDLMLGEGQAEPGGAVNNEGTLTVREDTISNNEAPAGKGGAIENTSTGNLTVLESTLSKDKANEGGAINNNGALEIVKSTINENTATAGGGAIENASTGSKLAVHESTLSKDQAKEGGAIDSKGTIEIVKSTIDENTATAGGGAIENASTGKLTVLDTTSSKNEAASGGAIDSSGTLAIVNSTINNNNATSGGGIFVFPIGGTETIANATIAGNTATGRGGDIYFESGPVQVKDSIIAGGIAPEGRDCSLHAPKEVESGGYNLSDAAIAEECELKSTGDREDVSEINLEPLKANGGPTETMELGIESAAIGAGNPAGCTDQQGHPLTTDQRGRGRPPRCDVGAFQTPAADLGVSVGAPATAVQNQSFTYTITVKNAGGVTPKSVMVIDKPPVGATLVSAPECSGTVTLTCIIANLAPGEQKILSVTVKQAQLGGAVDAAIVTSAVRDPEPANNLATATTTIESPPATPSGGGSSASSSPPATPASAPAAPGNPARTPPSAGDLIMANTQKLGPTLTAYFLCKVKSCAVTLSWTILLGKKHIPIHPPPTTIKENQKQKLAVKLSKALRSELAKALAKHQKVTVTVLAYVHYEGVRAKTQPLTSTLRR